MRREGPGTDPRYHPGFLRRPGASDSGYASGGTPDPDLARIAASFLAARGGVPRKWSNRPGDTYAEHSHPYYKVLFCLEGSIEFTTPVGVFQLSPGDRLDLPPGTPHAALVGPAGVACVEAAYEGPPA